MENKGKLGSFWELLHFIFVDIRYLCYEDNKPQQAGELADIMHNIIDIYMDSRNAQTEMILNLDNFWKKHGGRNWKKYFIEWGWINGE